MIYPAHPNTKDIVIAGPDFSGTSTQLKFATDFFLKKGLKIRDITGTETEALFHAQKFSAINLTHKSFEDFSNDASIPINLKKDFVYAAQDLVAGWSTGRKLMVASMVKNDFSTYIDPDSADVWIMEEPPHRSGGQITRVIEHNRKAFDSKQDQVSASVNHQNYRTDEFLRFRKVLREKGKTIIRSRSEESACYQIFDEHTLPNGISMKDYLELPGHRIAFANPPTHIIVACGKKDWTREQYLEFKKTRLNGRTEDEYEKDIDYQIMVNQRYASDWIDKLYEIGCGMNNSRPPQIIRIDMTLSKPEIEKEINNILRRIG